MGSVCCLRLSGSSTADCFDLAHKGLKDEEIIVLLRRQRHATFFTRDADFLSAPRLRHSGYCIVVADVRQNEVAAFVRRFLWHPDFDTQTKRMGRVVRISHAGLGFWRLRSLVRCIRFGNVR